MSSDFSSDQEHSALRMASCTSNFVVYVPDMPISQPILVEADGNGWVQTLADIISDRYKERSSIMGREIQLLKCDTIPMMLPPDEEDGFLPRAVEWVLKFPKIKPMPNVSLLSQHFPGGPTGLRESKIDIIIISDTILAYLYSLKHGLKVPSAGPNTDRFPLVGLHAGSKFSEPKQHLESFPIPGMTEEGSDLHKRPDLYGFRIDSDPAVQKFYWFWYAQDYEKMFKQKIIALAISEEGLGDEEKCCLPSIPQTSNKLYVLDFYWKLVHALEAFQDMHPEKGIVLTGQPGTGKTAFLWFMLICCIMRHRNVLFYHNDVSRYFFEGRVYVAVRQNPILIEHPNIFTWSLIDSDLHAAPPPSYLVKGSVNLFPVQASSPNEVRYRYWLKQRQGYIWGMPSWTFEELMEGLKIQAGYGEFIYRLKQAIEHEKDQASRRGERTDDVPDSDQDMMQVDDEANGLSRVLPKASREALPPAYAVVQKNINDRMGVHVEETAIVNAVRFARDKLGRWHDEERIFALAAKDAIYQFGNVLRDVTEAVYIGDHKSLFENIRLAINSGKSNLGQLTNALLQIGKEESMTKENAPSHQLFIIEPRDSNPLSAKNDVFVPMFKSDVIKDKLEAAWGHLKIEEAKKFVSVFRLFPESSTLAGWIFQSLACELMSSANVQQHLVRMQMTEVTDTYVVYKTGDLKTAPREPFPNRKRIPATVTFPDNNLIWVGQYVIEDLLCIPASPNHPLFDAFFVDIDVVSNTAVVATIYVIQTTTSQKHEGSAAGYKYINTIMEHVRRRAARVLDERQTTLKGRIRKIASGKDKNVTTKLKYLYVSPTPEIPRVWKIPASGWTATRRGEVFALHMEISPNRFMGL
ncbi:uncharacterized protein FOMMEDRAFT_152496 [Fomitiporia mediterranea MF3/22]|uniref:uncharacterized protein n=1 Tax=Fomitiporia mediterranea (strain MF3/22) TaxID=694068 RepID=UPI000440887F|nr:uncharacterized protein FOMMEDRAFT_152496 [Fomitiporia mediterranea MF3/22]EJD07138.1 hypothetical protein FOMMEDRAFT_152496 [Fomitiporia mediterranea MF3/22]